jgi:hypothetical protein
LAKHAFAGFQHMHGLFIVSDAPSGLFSEWSKVGACKAFT